MEKSTTPSINLAKNRGESLSDRILTFALTTGRILVIVTEAIALGAFLYRFGLDRQLVTLHDNIAQEQAVVALLKNNETQYRNLQDRLSVASIINTDTTNDVKLYKSIYNTIPADMDLTSLTLSNANVLIAGNISSLVSLTSFVNKLKSASYIDSVSIDKIENKTSQGVISVNITVTLKKTTDRLVP